MTNQPPLPLKLANGEDLPPPKGEEYRKHTAEHWKKSEPESYDQCIGLIRAGITNQSELAREFGKSRNSIQALMIAEFEVGELDLIAQKLAEIGRVTGIQKTIELIEKASRGQDAAGIAMGTKLISDMAQVMGSKPTQIIEERSVSIHSYEQRIRQLTEAATGRQPAHTILEAEVLSVSQPTETKP